MVFWSKSVLNGSCQSNAPFEAFTPIRNFRVCEITWRTPPNVAMIGDPYPGPSPVHCQRGFAVAASNDVSAPLSCPPTWTMTLVPSTRGDVAVPYCGSTPGAGTRQRSLPLARSNADRMPPIPSVKTRPPAMAGVDFGPAPCDCAAGLRMYGAG